ncbi:uncharacterized protein LOC117807479 isoform X2 [Notolabrus celidotus]|uniref:uncharacterized protein LOC117807479 isoform X2 n=1 Tax=Notolabrus celidotus TaxID=1203425 RepID=UPI001490652D|nr:uncharacterized protein LOC117807479 isoform X2 [Notolabrus celidotus]
MELTGFLLTLSSLTVSPNRSQFFKYESLSLSCEENRNSSGWRVRAKTVRGVSECGLDWGSIQASSCIITEAYQWNSGVYWCESPSGETSSAVNITVTDNNVILESPLHPVMEGESVTLRCTTQSNSSSLQASSFMKDRSRFHEAITGQITIPAASKSDEGLYMCVITDVGASTESWLSVRGVTEQKTRATEQAKEEEGAGQPTEGSIPNVTEAPDVSAAPPLSVFRVMCHLATGAPYLLSTILLGLIYRDTNKGVGVCASAAQAAQETTNNDDVLMEEI